MAETQGTFFQMGECPHAHKVVVPEKRGPHVAKLICKDCRKFFGWIPKPENVQRQKENAEILTALSKIENLPPWERQFIRGLMTHKHISPKQQTILLDIRDKFLKKGANANDGFNGVPMPPN